MPARGASLPATAPPSAHRAGMGTGARFCIRALGREGLHPSAPDAVKALYEALAKDEMRRGDLIRVENIPVLPPT